jgi:dihydroorotase
MKKTLFKNVKILFPGSSFYSKNVDFVWSEKGIEKIDTKITDIVDETIDGKELCLIPGLIDIYCTSGEPNVSSRETFDSLCHAAKKGGFTNIFHFPSIQNAFDSKSDISFINKYINENVKIHPVANIVKSDSKNLMSEILEISNENIAGFTNQNQHSISADLLVNLFNYCKTKNSHFFVHPEKVSLSKGGQIHQGKSALYCGFKGIPAEAETIALKEILDIAKYCSYAPVIIDLSTKESIDIVKNYRKEMDFKVGVSINNLIFNEDSVLDFDTNFKLNPPLRAKVDQDALLSALMDGTIDFVYTQHTPLTPEEKVLEFDLAENGNIGLQTSFQALIEKLGNSQIELISNVLSLNQSNYFNIDLGHFEEGKKGRFSIIDLNNPETFNLQNNKSLSKNSAFINKTFSTKIITTLN